MQPAHHPKQHKRRTRARIAAGLLVAGLTVAGSQAGCFYNDSGLAPPHEGFYYPTGLVTSPGRTALYVANSDFDLAYNGGTVQVLDLATMRGAIRKMLAGVRCTEQVEECPEYVSLGGKTTDTLQAVCRGIPMNAEGKQAQANGASCVAPTDCQSGVCFIPDGSTTGNCQACQSSFDCAGGGYCQCTGTATGTDACNGTCMLDLATNKILTPAACSPILPTFPQASQLPAGAKAFDTIGAFASGAVLAQSGEPGSGARLFVPVRGDPSITWFDIADDRVPGAQNPFLLDCGAPSGGDRRCSDAHRMGVDPYDNFRDLTLPVEPVGLDVSAADPLTNQNAIVSAHQIANGPAVGLSVNNWNVQPSFQYYLTGVSPGPTEVAHIPPPAIVAATQHTSTPMLSQPGFLVTYNMTAEVDVVRVDFDALSNPARPFLLLSQKAPVTLNASGTDSRGVAVDPTKRQACEAACSKTDLTCLGNCVQIPLDVFIANRTPPTLLLGQLQTTLVPSPTGGAGSAIYDALSLYSSVPVKQGVSRVLIGHVLGTDGALHTRVFAVCFDSRFILAYDPAAITDLPDVIQTGDGPHAISFDACCDPKQPACQAKDACASGESPHAYLYVGHFLDSYLGVVDLDLNHASTSYGTMFASIGIPVPPPETM